MYIALKWLFSLNTILWLGLCVSDILQVNHKKINIRDLNSIVIDAKSNKNMSLLKSDVDLSNYGPSSSSVMLLYSTFIAMAYLFSTINYHNRIVWKLKLNLEYSYQCFYSYLVFLLESVTYKFTEWTTNLIDFGGKFMNNRTKSPQNFNTVINIILLKRIKGLIEEKRKVSKLLFITIQENKNLNIKYHLESLAKNRFALYVDDSKRQIKINRSRHIFYQNLYLISHQENIFLKSRLEKLTKEKKKIENNLLSVINQVYLSKNKDLKAYCSQFVVQTKDNFIKTDVKGEVSKFIRKYQTTSNASMHSTQISKNICNYSNSDYQNEEDVGSSKKYGPQMRGEYVWAVKDKNGMIDKLYEYKSEYYSGESVRRIREYSVYYVKDSFLAHHRTLANTDNIQEQWISTVTNQHFVTGSHVFQRFLQNYPQSQKLALPSL